MGNRYFTMSGSVKAIIFTTFWLMGAYLLFNAQYWEDIISKIATVLSFIAPFVTCLFPSKREDNVNVSVNNQMRDVQKSLVVNNPTNNGSSYINIGSSVVHDATEISQNKTLIQNGYEIFASERSEFLLTPDNADVCHTVKFRKSFAHPPKVIASLTRLDESAMLRQFPYNDVPDKAGGLDSVIRYECIVDTVTEDSFNIRLRIWNNNIVYSAGVSWLAIGEAP